MLLKFLHEFLSLSSSQTYFTYKMNIHLHDLVLSNMVSRTSLSYSYRPLRNDNNDEDHCDYYSDLEMKTQKFNEFLSLSILVASEDSFMFSFALAVTSKLTPLCLKFSLLTILLC